jgi:hypothetical protein
MFLVHPTLTEEHILATCEAVKKVMGAAVRDSSLGVRMSPDM